MDYNQLFSTTSFEIALIVVGISGFSVIGKYFMDENKTSRKEFLEALNNILKTFENDKQRAYTTVAEMDSITKSIVDKLDILSADIERIKELILNCCKDR